VGVMTNLRGLDYVVSNHQGNIRSVTYSVFVFF